MIPGFKTPLSKRGGLAFAHDVAMACLAFALALALRLGETAPQRLLNADLWVALGIFAGVAAVVFLATNLYRGIWRYASLNDLVNIAKAATLTVLVFLPITFMVTRLEALPRSSLVITWLLLIALLAGPRILYRLLKDGSLVHVLEKDSHLRVPVLLAGAGDAAELFIAAMKRDRQANYEVQAVIDEKGRRVGRRIHDVPVIGMGNDLQPTLEKLRARTGRAPQRVIATKDLSPDQLNRLLEFAERNGMRLDRLPKLTDFRTGEPRDITLRPVAIEDLLRRPQIVLDPQPVRDLVVGKRVLVTGAGGSIGSELVRQLAPLGPSELTLLDASELNLYQIDREVGESWPTLPRQALLADVRDRAAVDAVFARTRPELVLHTAALKHVPIVEAQPVEGVLTNVRGTCNVADACRRFGTANMVLVSTDKAVNPTNVMGATKRLAESYCQALDLEARRGGPGTHFVTVRFGNVLNSTGSVVPLFQHQLARGGPLTVTHPEMTRYFMTIPEAVRLILQAAALGSHRPRESAGKIYVLDMGAPVKIVELAEQMIRLAGKRPYKDVEIVFTGLRPGEKLHEELFHDEETLVHTAQPGLRLAETRTTNAEILRRSLEELLQTADAHREERTLDLLGKLVPEWGRGGEVIPLARSRP